MKRLPPLAELRAFEAAARHLGFKAAAQELGDTPTAISHQIRLLEAHCDQLLFRRRPRPLALTPAGALLAPGITEGLQNFSDAWRRLDAAGEAMVLRMDVRFGSHELTLPRGCFAACGAFKLSAECRPTVQSRPRQGSTRSWQRNIDPRE